MEDERAMGIEPTTFSLARRRSTGELRSRKMQYIRLAFPAQDLASKTWQKARNLPVLSINEKGLPAHCVYCLNPICFGSHFVAPNLHLFAQK